MARDPALARSPLFEGLDDAELDVVAERMRARQFAPDEQLCRAGDPSDRIWLITGGLVSWTAAVTAGGEDIVLRMRKGDVIGAQDAITGSERTATVVASMRTSALELDADDLVSLARQFPQILINVIQTQRERLFRASARSAALFSGSVRSSAGRGGEEVGVVAGQSLTSVVAPRCLPGPLALVRRRLDGIRRSRVRERDRPDSRRPRAREARSDARRGGSSGRAGRERR